VPTAREVRFEADELSEQDNLHVRELEPERLRKVLARLMEAQQEALEVTAQALEPGVESLDEGEQAEASTRLEAALEDVLAILEAAQEDVRALLESDA
jgi:hypothetical protein